MTAYEPAYRLTVYAPRSTDASEATVLTPIGGAAHSDDFQVTTLPGVAGWQPYLDLPEGRRGRLDLKTRRLDQGQQTVRVLDARTGTANASRWASAFLGDSGGRPQLLGCLALLEESTDGGTTWADYFTGRINRVGLVDDLWLELQLRDPSSELNYEVFGTRPAASVSYALEPSVLPLGVTAAYGLLPAITRMGGTWGTSGVLRTITLATGSTGFSRADNLVTRALVPGTIPTGGADKVPVQPGLRVRFTAGSTANKEAELVAIEAKGGSSVGPNFKVSKLYVKVVDSSDPYYVALPNSGDTANAATLSFEVRQVNPPTTEAVTPRIILADVHPVTVWKDLLDGKFSRLSAAGAVTRTFPCDSAAFTTLIADTSFPLCRFVVESPAKLQDWVERNILLPYGLGAYLDASGQVVPLDLRPPQSTPSSTTITDADLQTEDALAWQVDREEAVTVVRVKTRTDYPVNVAALYLGSDPIPEFNTALFTSAETEFVYPTFGNSDLGERTLTVEALGLRVFAGETLTAGSAVQSRSEWVRSQADAIQLFFQAPYAAGPMFVTLPCRRTANTDVQPGAWVVADCDKLPDPGSNLRGGNRLLRVVERSDYGLLRQLRCVDAGPGTIATAPTVATPAQEASNTYEGITVAVTLNGSSEAATLWVNATSTSTGSVPSATDAGWRLVTPVGQTSPLITATGTVTVRGLPSNRRIWVRVRTETGSTKKLPSAYAFPAGTGYVATAAYTAPSALGSATVTTKSATLTWTVGTAALRTVVRIVGGASSGAADAATPVALTVLPPGTARYDLVGLDSGGPWWHCDVYHIDPYGGSTSVANLAAFQATGTAATAPTPAAVLVTRSFATSPTPPPASGGLIPAGRTGVDLLLVPAPTGLGLEIELSRAPDSGGSPGTYAVLATVPGADISARGYWYRDDLPLDGTTTYWYKARHTGSGVSASSYTTDVSAQAGWLPIVAYGGDNGEPILGQTETIFLPHSAFAPISSATTWAATSGYIRCATAGVQADMQAPIVLPAGVTISGMRARVKTVNAGDKADLVLYRVDDTPTLTSVASLTPGASASWQDVSTTFTEVTTGDNYLLILNLLGASSVGDGALTSVELDYVRNSYRQAGAGGS
ncbi:MAG TPA: hypothetical protein PK594_02545, partial [Mycobacterium sp.]|nr:hypothetical protein [Mycobacterium sp.]